MKKIDWKIVEFEENMVYVEFVSDNVVNKLSFEWKGNEQNLIDEIDNMAIDILDRLDRKMVVDDNTKRKLLPLRGGRTMEHVLEKRKNSIDATQMMEEI